jgi:hypothetical protein
MCVCVCVWPHLSVRPQSTPFVVISWSTLVMWGACR